MVAMQYSFSKIDYDNRGITVLALAETFTAISEQNNEQGPATPGHVVLERDEKQSFIGWLEANAASPIHATSLYHEFEERLKAELNSEEIYDEMDEKTGARKLNPNRGDSAVVYLVKASLSYLQHCQIKHNQEQDGFSKWLTLEGKIWAVNDALPQTLAKATHAYSHAAADYRRETRLKERELLQTLSPL